MSSRVGRVTVSELRSASPADQLADQLGRVGDLLGARPSASRQLTLAPAAARPPSVGRGALGDDPAVGEHRQPVGQCLGLVEVVGGEQDRGALGGQRPDQVPELAAGLRVEPGRRLVEEEQLGAADDAERHVHPAALAAGQRRGSWLPALSVSPTSSITSSAGARVGVEAGEVPDHLADGQLGRVVGVLQHDADPGPPVAGRPCPGPRPAPAPRRRRAAVPLEDLHRGGLAGAVRARAARRPRPGRPRGRCPRPPRAPGRSCEAPALRWLSCRRSCWVGRARRDDRAAVSGCPPIGGHEFALIPSGISWPPRSGRRPPRGSGSARSTVESWCPGSARRAAPRRARPAAAGTSPPGRGRARRT